MRTTLTVLQQPAFNAACDAVGEGGGGEGGGGLAAAAEPRQSLSSEQNLPELYAVFVQQQ